MLKRRKGLRRVSKKRQALNKERRAFVDDVLSRRPWCEVCPKLVALDSVEYELTDNLKRRHRATQVHEPLTRARGGSILDDANALPVCAAAHRWIHTHPREATELGLLKSAYGKADAG